MGSRDNTRRRGWISRRLGFWFTAPILAAAVLAEGIGSIFRFLVFPFRAARVKAHIFAVMARGGARISRAAAVLFVVAGCTLAGGTLGGCANRYPGGSFSDQVDNLAWSAWAIGHMDYSGQQVITDFNQNLFDEMDGKLLTETIELFGW